MFWGGERALLDSVSGATPAQRESRDSPALQGLLELLERPGRGVRPAPRARRGLEVLTDFQDLLASQASAARRGYRARGESRAHQACPARPDHREPLVFRAAPDSRALPGRRVTLVRRDPPGRRVTLVRRDPPGRRVTQGLRVRLGPLDSRVLLVPRDRQAQRGAL